MCSVRRGFRLLTPQISHPGRLTVSIRVRFVVLILALFAPLAHAEDLSMLDKGHRVLIQNGLQTIGLVNTGDVFHVSTYQAANYTSILWWQAGSDPSAAPSFPWVRAVPDPTAMPDLTPS